MFEKFAAGATLAVCIVLLVRLALGHRRRSRFDAAARRLWSRARTAVLRLVRSRSSRRKAGEAARDAIARARGASVREGNVIRPRAFRRPRKPH
jgi:hypothetical protein